MKNLIVNGNNVSSDLATYTYTFPIGAQPTFKKGDQIALSSLSMYYSWPSITSSIGNNTFSYKWWVGDVLTTFSVTIPDGNYTVSELNAFLQYTFVSNTHYMLDSSGDYVYFMQLTSNSTAYAIQLDISPIPDTADATTLGYTLPSGASWTKPTDTAYPQFVVGSTDFRYIIGFNAQTFPTSTTAASYSTVTSKTSDFTPQVTPVSTVVVTCSLVHNSASIPDTLMYSFSPDVSYGSLITLQPAYPTFMDIQPGKVSEFSVTFLDQDFGRLKIKDSNVVVMLTIKDKSEAVG